MNRWGFPALGAGIGLDRSQLGCALADGPRVALFEVISEEYIGDGELQSQLERLSELAPILLHGTCLSLGHEGEVDFAYLEGLEALADRVHAAGISDHLRWTGARERHAPGGEPFAYTEESLRRLAERIRRVQDFLERPIALENPYTRRPSVRTRIPEHEFLARLAEATDSPLLLDLESLCRSALQQDFDPYEYLETIPADRVVEVHLGLPPEARPRGARALERIAREGAWELFGHLTATLGALSTIVECHKPLPEYGLLRDGALRARAVLEDNQAVRAG